MLLHQVSSDWRRFDPESRSLLSPRYLDRYFTLKTLEVLMCGGSFNWYALTLIHSMTSIGPILCERSLLYWWRGSRSLVITTQTNSPGSKRTSHRLKSAFSLYLASDFLRLVWAWRWVLRRESTKSAALPWTRAGSGTAVRSKGLLGRKLYTT